MCPDRGRLRQRGFTLVEMMIVVAVIALLSMVVYPSFQGAIRKARRADARSALTTAAQMLERYSTENPSAGYSTATLGGSGATAVYSDKSENKSYALALSNLAASTFTLSAVPQAAQATDPCGTFTINEHGVRGVTGGSLLAADCW